MKKYKTVRKIKLKQTRALWTAISEALALNPFQGDVKNEGQVSTSAWLELMDIYML